MRVLGALVGAIAGMMLAASILSAGSDSYLVMAMLGAIVGGLAIHRRTAKTAQQAAMGAHDHIPAPPVSVASTHTLEAEGSTGSFLDDAYRRGIIDRPIHERLAASLATRSAIGVGATPALPQRPPGSRIPGPTGPERLPMPAPSYEPMSARLARAPKPVSGSSVSTWFARAREAVVSDVAVHGLAYLGVLLVFVGALGFLLFSFGTLSHAARPWAELALPTALLSSAWYLRRRGAPVVATALGVLGGVLLPVVLFASFVDGVAFPPEFTGAELAWAMIATSLGLAALYAASARVWPESSLRFLVAPLLWTALWSVGLLLPDTPAEPLRAWTAAQFALVAIGVAATAVAVSRWPDRPLARDARPSLLPGAIFALGVGLLLAAGEGWPWWPLVVLGLASIVSTEALAERLGDPLSRALPAPLLWIAVAGVQVRFGDQVAGPVLVLASFALLEWQTWRARGGPIPLALHAAGVGVGIFVAYSVAAAQPLALVGALIPVVVWAQVRRLRPLPGVAVESLAPLVVALAAIAPVALAGALVAALPDEIAMGSFALALVGLAAVARYRADDVALTWWVVASAVLLTGMAADWRGLSAELAAAIAGASTIAVIVTPAPDVARCWIAVAGVCATTWLALEATGLGPLARWGTIAVTAAAVTVLTAWWRERVAMHLSLAAWVVSVGAAAAVGTMSLADPWLVVSVTAWTVATVVATLAFERWDRGPEALAAAWFVTQGAPPLVHVVPIALSAAGPVLIALAADRAWPSIGVDVRVAVGVIGFLEAASTWLLRARPVVSRTLGLAAFAVAGAAAIASVAPVELLELSVWTTGAMIAVVTVMAPEARHPFLSWIAWAATGFLAVQAGRVTGMSDRDLALTAFIWASVLSVGALVADDVLEGRRRAGEYVRRGSLVPPATLALAVMPVATVLVLEGSDLRIAALAFSGAAICVLIAWLLRLGAISAGAWALATVATVVSVPWSPLDDPWIAVPWAALVAGVGLLARHHDQGTPIERRWDLPAFAIAALGLAAALTWAVEVDEVAVTWSAAGILVVAVAWALRSAWLTTIGWALVVVGSIDAGHGWAALVMAIVAVVVAITAVRYGEEQMHLRLWHQAGAAALGAGAAWELGAWADWSFATLAGVALTLAGAAVIAGVVAFLRDSEGRWVPQGGLIYLAMQSLGVYAAALAWPAREPMMAALLVAAGAALVVGSFWRVLPLTMAAPVLAGAAWLVAIDDLLTGSAMWWAAAAGLVLLVESAIVRGDRRARGQPVINPSIAFLEYVGMATLLVPSLVEIFAIGPMRGLVAVGVGLSLSLWGVVTKVRRRLFGGLVGVVTAVTLMLVGPIARLVPAVEGPVLWAALVLLGVLLVVVATSLERGRARLARSLRRLDEMLGAWE
jgi:hypothetical protein